MKPKPIRLDVIEAEQWDGNLNSDQSKRFEIEQYFTGGEPYGYIFNDNGDIEYEAYENGKYSWIIWPGDYIITWENGERMGMNKKRFESVYEPLKNI